MQPVLLPRTGPHQTDHIPLGQGQACAMRYCAPQLQCHVPTPFGSSASIVFIGNALVWNGHVVVTPISPQQGRDALAWAAMCEVDPSPDPDIIRMLSDHHLYPYLHRYPYPWP